MVQEASGRIQGSLCMADEISVCRFLNQKKMLWHCSGGKRLVWRWRRGTCWGLELRLKKTQDDLMLTVTNEGTEGGAETLIAVLRLR